MAISPPAKGRAGSPCSIWATSLRVVCNNNMVCDALTPAKCTSIRPLMPAKGQDPFQTFQLRPIRPSTSLIRIPVPFFAHVQASRSFSIENQQKWCDDMIKDPLVKCLTEHAGLVYSCVAPVQKVTGFGHVRRADVGKMRPYVVHPDVLKKQHGVAHYDVVLVDGRFRRACALYAMKYIDSTSVVLIDDWADKSRGYHSVLEFFEQVELLSDMVVLRIKKNVDWTRWELAFKKALKDEM
eukprot:GHVU01122070.1.p1 GENE.GHVU01122070.1~~GHVU01122070.1.p1  ORF type:complete len:239 (-),score=11.51 GHVU01122070.1:582-1298(-)